MLKRRLITISTAKIMKFYSVFIKKDQHSKIEDIAIIEEGFFWTAFFMGIFWFLFYRMWRNVLAFVALQWIFLFCRNVGLISSFDLFLLELSLFLIIGFNAGYWLAQHLVKKKYKSLGFVLADGPQDARLKAMRILEHNYQNLSFDEFSSSIIDPKACKMSVKTFVS